MNVKPIALNKKLPAGEAALSPEALRVRDALIERGLETPMVETYKAVLYFVTSDLVRVVILVLFPAITLFLLPL